VRTPVGPRSIALAGLTSWHRHSKVSSGRISSRAWSEDFQTLPVLPSEPPLYEKPTLERFGTLRQLTMASFGAFGTPMSLRQRLPDPRNRELWSERSAWRSVGLRQVLINNPSCGCGRSHKSAFVTAVSLSAMLRPERDLSAAQWSPGTTRRIPIAADGD
jgi:hypothetical protein